MKIEKEAKTLAEAVEKDVQAVVNPATAGAMETTEQNKKLADKANKEAEKTSEEAFKGEQNDAHQDIPSEVKANFKKLHLAESLDDEEGCSDDCCEDESLNEDVKRVAEKDFDKAYSQLRRDCYQKFGSRIEIFEMPRYGKEPIEMGVNWASIGTVSADDTSQFGNNLIDAAKMAREFPYNGMKVEYDDNESLKEEIIHGDPVITWKAEDEERYRAGELADDATDADLAAYAAFLADQAGEKLYAFGGEDEEDGSMLLDLDGDGNLKKYVFVHDRLYLAECDKNLNEADEEEYPHTFLGSNTHFRRKNLTDLNEIEITYPSFTVKYNVEPGVQTKPGDPVELGFERNELARLEIARDEQDRVENLFKDAVTKTLSDKGYKNVYIGGGALVGIPNAIHLMGDRVGESLDESKLEERVEPIKIKSNSGSTWDLKPTDYRKVKFPFSCYARVKGSDDEYYPVKITGYYANGKVYDDDQIIRLSQLYRNGPDVWSGETLSSEYKGKLNKFYRGREGTPEKISVYPSQIKDLQKYLEPVTREEMIDWVKKYWGEDALAEESHEEIKESCGDWYSVHYEVTDSEGNTKRDISQVCANSNEEAEAQVKKSNPNAKIIASIAQKTEEPLTEAVEESTFSKLYGDLVQIPYVDRFVRTKFSKDEKQVDLTIILDDYIDMDAVYDVLDQYADKIVVDEDDEELHIHIDMSNEERNTDIPNDLFDEIMTQLTAGGRLIPGKGKGYVSDYGAGYDEVSQIANADGDKGIVIRILPGHEADRKGHVSTFEPAKAIADKYKDLGVYTTERTEIEKTSPHRVTRVMTIWIPEGAKAAGRDERVVKSKEEPIKNTTEEKPVEEAVVKTKLGSFEPWEGAIDTFNKIKEAGKLGELEDLIDELYDGEVDETKLNDLLWFEDSWVLETLGIENDD